MAAGGGDGALFRRIGADFKTFVDNLSALFDFDWSDLLAQSDEIYRQVLGALSGVGDRFGEVEAEVVQLMTNVGDGLDLVSASPALNRSIAELLDPPKLPRFDELDLVMDYFERALSSPRLQLDIPAFDLGLPDVGDLLDRVTDRIPIDLLRDPTRLVGERGSLRALAEYARDIRSDISGLFETVLKSCREALATVGVGVEKLLTTRLAVPWLTDLVEDTILSADGTRRRFNVLRVLALAASISATLGGGLGGDGAATKGLVIACFCMGLVNGLMSAVRALPIPEPHASRCAMAHGAMIYAQGMLSLAVWCDAPEGEEQIWAVSMALNAVYGLLTLVLGATVVNSPSTKPESAEATDKLVASAAMIGDVVIGGLWIGFAMAAMVDGFYWPCTWIINGASAAIDAKYPDGKMPAVVKRDQQNLKTAGVLLNLAVVIIAVSTL